MASSSFNTDTNCSHTHSKGRAGCSLLGFKCIHTHTHAKLALKPMISTEKTQSDALGDFPEPSTSKTLSKVNFWL